MEKYGTVQQATDDNVIGHMCFECHITEAAGTHFKYVTLLLLQGNSGYTNVPECYVTHMLPVLLFFKDEPIC